MMVAFTIPGEPVPFARAGAQGKRRFTPKKQADFMTAVKIFAARAMAGRTPFDGPISLRVRAVYLVPDSWPQKRKDAALWKASKPDADNLLKILGDSMNTIVFRDDAQIASLHIQKIYGPIAGVTVEVSSLEGVRMWEGDQ